MICPRCGEGRAVVKDTRDVEFGEVKRSRKCDNCGYIFHTREVTKEVFEEMTTGYNMYTKMMDSVQKRMKGMNLK